MQVYVNVQDKRWDKYNIDFDKIANAAVSAVYKDSEVSITLVDDKEIHKINKEYRGIDKPTNVLSFELGDDVLMGDIFISIDTVLREAHDERISVEEHTAHLIVHGMLHLQGYDHIKDSDAEKMEAKEIKILKKLGYKNPYEINEDDNFVCKNASCCPGQFITKIKSWRVREGGFLWYLLTGLCGVVASFGFAPFYLWPLTILGIGFMYYLTVQHTNKISFWCAWLRVSGFGALYGISMFWWVLNSIYVVPELAMQFAIWTIPGLIGIGLICAIILSIPFAVIRYVNRKPPYRAILFATIWTLVLWGREWFLTGFPWNPVSNIFINVPMLANSMALWGALGLSFIICGLIATLVEIISNKHTKTLWCVFGIYVALFLVGCVYGYHNMHVSDKANFDSSPIIRIVQPAKSAVYKMPASKQEAQDIAQQKIRDLFVWATQSNDVYPDIVVYPETSYPYVVIGESDSFPLSRILNTNVVIGVNHYHDGNMYNSMVVADKTGKINHLYSKSHLVPFGEYRPFGDIVPTPGQLKSGTGPELLSINTKHGDFIIAPAICYEIIFSDSLIKSGDKPNAIINITNDTWFGKTPGVYQHLDMVRRYAIESGLPIIRSNYSGISAFVAPDGNIISMLPVGQTGSLDGIVWGAHNTVYRIFGRDLLMIFILLFSIIASISISVFQKKD